MPETERSQKLDNQGQLGGAVMEPLIGLALASFLANDRYSIGETFRLYRVETIYGP